MNKAITIATLRHSPANKAIVIALRIAVGITFTLSGFAKAIDPWGSYYKFIEYFAALGLEQLQWSALFCAFAIATIETALGICLLTGVFRRATVFSMLTMMTVMLPLTLFLAVTNAVTDCGCFGDALHLSNTATFLKNLLLTAALIWLAFFNRHVPGIYGPAVHWIVAAIPFFAALRIATVGYFTQPLIDFRPFKTGTELITPSLSVSDDDYIFIYQKNGKEAEFDINNLPDDDSEWEFVDRRNRNHTNVIEQHGPQLALFQNGLNVSNDVLNGGNALLFLFPDINHVNISYTYQLNLLTDIATREGTPIYGITSASNTDIDNWNDISMASYTMLQADDSDIKMIARGNPAVVYIKQGKILWKRTLSSIPPQAINNKTTQLENASADFKPATTLRHILLNTLIAMTLLLLINRTYRIITLHRR